MSTTARSMSEVRWRRWRRRRASSLLLRLVIALLPIVVALLTGWAWRANIDPGSSTAARVAWFIGFVAVTAIGYVTTERVVRRWAPLGVLLRMSVAFPDRLPSRFSVALRSGSTRRLLSQLDGSAEDDDLTAHASRLLALSLALNRHDRLTRGHGERVRAYAGIIGEELHLDEDELVRLRWAAFLHDVGKLLVPSEVLTKPGPLDEDEYRIVKEHAELGAAIAEPMRPWLGDWVDAVGEHHERWDGEGYPNRKAGPEISLAARIVAVADVFDVMTSPRSYRAAVSADEARAEIVRCSGSQFDPAVVAAFVRAGLGAPSRAATPLLLLLAIPGVRSVLQGVRTSTTMASGTAAVVLGAAIGVVTGLPERVEPPTTAPPVTTGTTTTVATTTSTAPEPSAPRPAPTATPTTGPPVTAPTVVPVNPTIPPPGTPTAAPRPTTTSSVSRPTTPQPPSTTSASTSTATTASTTTAPALPTTTTTTAPPPSTTDAPLRPGELAVVVTEDGTATGTIPVDLGDTTFELVTPPSAGTLVLDDDGTLRYQPDPDVNGTDRAVVEVCTGDDVCVPYEVVIEITPVNDPPIALDDARSTRSGIPLAVDVLANDRDVDGDALTIRLDEPVDEGVTVRDGRIVVTSAFGEDRTIVAPYEAVDPDGAAASATLTVALVPGPVLALSSGPDRSDPRPLEGAAVPGPDLFVHVAAADGIAVARFFVDDPGRAGPPVTVERRAVFDLGTSDPVTGLARPYDVSDLAPGPHVVTAELLDADGVVVEVVEAVVVLV